MQKEGIRRQNPRRSAGSALLEAPGALILLLIFIVLPLLDLIALSAKYACCYSLHQMQIREASLLPASKAQAANGAVKGGIPTNWLESGLGAFADLAEPFPETSIQYKEGDPGANGVPEQFVVLQSRMRLKPFLSVPTPGLPQLPGLNAAFAISFESRKMLENPSNRFK